MSGKTIRVNAVWVFVGLLVGVLAGMAASHRESAWVETTCPVCEKSIGSGAVVMVHEACRSAEAKSQNEALVADTLHDADAASIEAEERLAQLPDG